MYSMYGHSIGHTRSIHIHYYLLMNHNKPKMSAKNSNPKMSAIEMAQEATFQKMLEIKKEKGTTCIVITPEGNKITWLLFPKAIIPSWLNAKSLLSYRALTREERRSIKKPLSKR